MSDSDSRSTPPETGSCKGFVLLPAPKGTCPECAVDHTPDQPHNAQSLHYQYHFYGRFGRWPKWEDAMAHCTTEVKEFCRAELAAAGVAEFNNPPCSECGAMTPEEAETKCNCGGDKDSCHGCTLWPDN